VVIYNDIIALGGKERKSLDMDFPEIPKEFLPDFIRGYFDGDGCIMQLKNKRVNSAFTCGSKKFLDTLHKILKEEAGIEGGSYDPSCVSLKFGKKDSLKLGNYMYRDNPELFLLRKRNKFY
jgi:intein/homing endonuclease